MPGRRWEVSHGVLFGLGALLVASCAGEPAPKPEAVTERAPEARLEFRPTTFDQLDGWYRDNPARTLVAFRRSCDALVERPPDQPMGPLEVAGRVADWLPVCRAAARVPATASAADARTFFEDWFLPYRVTDRGEAEGLFTGYYEPILDGAREPGGPYTVPLRRPPYDLVEVELGRFDPDLAGLSIRGRIADGRFVPYHSRAEIEDGALEGRDLALLWVDDPLDKFFLQIQGSGQVRLRDGSRIRVGYAAANGRPYRAIGRDLIEIGALEREEVSLQSIRAWLKAHPEAAETIMARNHAYVFFEERPELDPDDGPIGTQGVSLTGGRSLAVDLRYIPLGAPVWLETTAPSPDGERPLKRLMVAQDTGGAIKGVVRGDVFWGAGDHAEAIAGRMKSRGRYVLFLPRSLAPVG